MRVNLEDNAARVLSALVAILSLLLLLLLSQYLSFSIASLGNTSAYIWTGQVIMDKASTSR